MIDFAGLPAAERITGGLRDLARGDLSANALLVAIAAQRLRSLGVEVAVGTAIPAEPELALYAQLGGTVADPYFAYGAALRELDSFLSSLEARTSRRRPAAGG